MRFASLVLAFAFLFAGPSLAGSADSTLPAIGTFTFNGAPSPDPAPATIVLAAIR
ncbi:hypothetical protein [Tardiphaga alba]|uniref:hypothetical protein n=1 Tax=Tardiphaga alba TaxID=340268 RepID=UPI001BA9932D|nr:hypothetical protein [Tardiphaga alba]